MATFTGTNSDETITPSFVSSTVTAAGGSRPSNAPDTIDGGGGNDTIDSGGGNDTVTGGRGNDIVSLGSGDDLFVWNPGDGSDVVDGQGGTDTLRFNGSNVGENIDISANGERTRLFRDVGNVTMDLNSIEHIQLAALGGADVITVNDLAGTSVKQIGINLSGTPDSNAGDGQADTVIVNGSTHNDHIKIASTPASVVVSGLAEQVTISGADSASDTLVIDGLAGNDVIDASALRAGQIGLTIDGGDGNDTIISGGGADALFGGDGNDLFVWNPGDGNGIIEGQAGADTLEFNGSDANETITVSANGSRVALSRNVGSVTMDINGVESIVVDAGGGNDIITAGNGLITLTQLILDGGAGNDTITGGDGNDVLNGGNGNDVVSGGRGNDLADLGAGDDVFIWNPGDGSDTVEGRAGTDTLLFNGSNAGEHIDITANGSRTRLFRDVGNVTMNLNSIEDIRLAALGGADTITVGDLSGTGVKQLNIDLSGTAGSNIGDGQPDTVIVDGSTRNNHIKIATIDASIVISGLPAQVRIAGPEAANDSLVVDGLAGNDVIDASVLIEGQIALAIDGGDGNDTITGSGGADMLAGGAGDDLVTGGRGNDVALLGDGDDVFVWNPGDGSDVVEGQAGNDTLRFNGSNTGENITVSANGSRATLFRDVGAVTMDLNSIEHIDLATEGGADTITVNDLTGTGVTQVAINLVATGTNTGDSQPDQVLVNGTAGNDFITVGRSYGVVTVNGLAAQTTIAHADAANDTLVVNGLGGNDIIDASTLGAGHINLMLNGGDGDDTINGSRGNDTISGGRGNDVAFLGNGNDVFVWNPGDGSDIVEGDGGTDTLQFNGSNAGEHISISAIGSHVTLFRDVGAVTMSLDGIEHIQLSALGGADTITVNDLTGTDVKQVAVNLSGTLGGNAGDGQADTVIVNASAGNNHIHLVSSGGSVVVSGLPEQVTIDGAEAANDRLTVSAGAGDDVIDTSGVSSAPLSLTFIGGAGDDTFMFTAGQSGNDLIQDFQVHGGSLHGDLIALAGFSDHTFDQAIADGHIVQSGGGVAISDGTHVIATMQNVTLASLHAQDFRFS